MPMSTKNLDEESSLRCTCIDWTCQAETYGKEAPVLGGIIDHAQQEAISLLGGCIGAGHKH